MKKVTSLKKNDDFRTVYRAHRSRANRYFVMYILENGLSYNRLGISVSKKVGNSVVRHRLTRLIREAFRLHRDRFNSGLDLVVVVKASANPGKESNEKPLKCADVERNLLHLGRLHRILSDTADRQE
ncbi:MAG: ribonuclease P protein component [Lachnospiraceae bacterium]|nr:ribonuclease P protein component [Lachnospiraceae bacterium]